MKDRDLARRETPPICLRSGLSAQGAGGKGAPQAMAKPRKERTAGSTAAPLRGRPRSGRMQRLQMGDGGSYTRYRSWLLLAGRRICVNSKTSPVVASVVIRVTTRMGTPASRSKSSTSPGSGISAETRSSTSRT